jgi:hypothetical protein
MPEAKMDPKKKLAIFEKYDFSKTAHLKRAGINREDSRSDLYHDIAGMLQSLLINVSAIANGEVNDVDRYSKLQVLVYKSYGWLQSEYQGIDWDELDADDPDFSVFFKMKRLIDDLGQTISAFLENSRRKLGRKVDADNADKSYEKMQEQIEAMGDLMQGYLSVKENLRQQLGA